MQVVRKALDEGYEVRCTVRPRQNPADFLRDWGATTVQVLPSGTWSMVHAAASWFVSLPSCAAMQTITFWLQPANLMLQ